MALPTMDWIERVIRISSVTHESNDELVKFLLPLLHEVGLHVEEQRVIEQGTSFKNIIAYSHSLDAPELLVLNTHLDTVSYGHKKQWTKTGGDPFRATRVRDRVYGLGTADVKLDFLCKCWAIKEAKPWTRPIALVGTYGEERGLVGAMNLLAQKKLRPKFAMVGEPSNLELIYAHKGHLVLTVSFPLGNASKEGPHLKTWKGKSTHSATPHLGENALLRALHDIMKRGFGIVSVDAGFNSNKVPDYCTASVTTTQTAQTRQIISLVRFIDDLSKEFKRRKDTRFSPPFATISLNVAKTLNGYVEFTFDIRSLPDTDLSKLQARLDRELHEMNAKLIDVVSNLPLKGRKDGKFINAASTALRNCGMRVIKKTKASSTEAAVYQEYGAEAIVFGPGLSTGNVHRPNEFNSLRQMESATRFYTELIRMPVGEY